MLIQTHTTKESDVEKSISGVEALDAEIERIQKEISEKTETKIKLRVTLQEITKEITDLQEQINDVTSVKEVRTTELGKRAVETDHLHKDVIKLKEKIEKDRGDFLKFIEEEQSKLKSREDAVVSSEKKLQEKEIELQSYFNRIEEYKKRLVNMSTRRGIDGGEVPKA